MSQDWTAKDVLRNPQNAAGTINACLTSANSNRNTAAARIDELEKEVEGLRIALASIRDQGTGGPCAAVCVTTETLRGIAKQALTAGAKL